ncbi:MAG: helix-turn-helix transcriptional regulator [Polaribacter sp.]|nr:helix-turn-helix transcriptional regulator [Polaribacter sp.]MDG1811430.1 helix-turn-helix transcriptional regulator [Polaribacter sp.]MDG1993639.1 helix-turn-helix transcriptional regulator [Polaribacter sp.]
MISKFYGDRKIIKLTRIEKGYSQNNVGNCLKMSQISYHKVENGITQLKVETLLKIANVLEVKAMYLLAG